MMYQYGNLKRTTQDYILDDILDDIFKANQNNIYLTPFNLDYLFTQHHEPLMVTRYHLLRLRNVAVLIQVCTVESNPL